MEGIRKAATTEKAEERVCIKVVVMVRWRASAMRSGSEGMI
jgi:hypothetical protein